MKTKIFWLAIVFAIILNIIFTVSYPYGWWNFLNFIAVGAIIWSQINWADLWLKIQLWLNIK